GVRLRRVMIASASEGSSTIMLTSRPLVEAAASGNATRLAAGPANAGAEPCLPAWPFFFAWVQTPSLQQSSLSPFFLAWAQTPSLQQWSVAWREQTPSLQQSALASAFLAWAQTPSLQQLSVAWREQTPFLQQSALASAFLAWAQTPSVQQLSVAWREQTPSLQQSALTLAACAAPSFALEACEDCVVAQPKPPTSPIRR